MCQELAHAASALAPEEQPRPSDLQFDGDQGDSTAIRAHRRRWLPKPDSNEAVQAAIRATLELWLSTNLPLDDLTLTLEDANKNYILTCGTNADFRTNARAGSRRRG